MTKNQLESIPAKFAQAVARWGDRVALRRKELGLWRDITWNEYHDDATDIACGLISLGLEKGDHVAVIGDNCPEWVYAYAGVQCCGAAVVGVYATNAWEQVAHVVTHSEARFFFVENEEQLDKWLHFRDQVPLLEKVIVWDTEGLRHFSDPKVITFEALATLGRRLKKEHPQVLTERIARITPEDISVLIYTSGTTGPPKGAMLSHANCVWMGAAIGVHNPIGVGDDTLSFLPLCHIFEQLFTILSHYVYGHVVNFVESLDTITDNMFEVSPSIGYAVPRIWEKYYSSIMIRMADATRFKKFLFFKAYEAAKQSALRKRHGQPVPRWLAVVCRSADFAVFRVLKKRLGFDRMRIAYSGAAPIAPEILLFFQTIGINLVEGYGQTEGTGVTTTSAADQVKTGTVGKPLPGVEIKIAADGEILVRSPGVFKGYYKNPGATAETIKEGWLYSGDIGEIDADGYLKITDRKKDIIVTAGGKNISPQYIENKLKASLYINDAVVVGDRRKYLTALVILDEDNAVKYAQDHKIQFSTYRELSADPQIKALIQTEIDGVNTALSRVEQIKKFAVLPKKLYEEDGEVTPTMKVKRGGIIKAFENLIEAMY